MGCHRPPVHGHARRAGRHENRTIAWTYAFAPDALPPNTLDEHVLIGGRYFDLADTACHLVPEDGGTRLEIVVDYRVSTGFDWYAAPAGRLLVDDTAHAIRRFHERRAEAQPSST